MKVLSQYLPVFMRLPNVSQSTHSSLYCGLSLPVPGRSNGGEERETLQYFSESKENEMRQHIREKRIRENRLFTSTAGAGQGVFS